MSGPSPAGTDQRCSLLIGGYHVNALGSPTTGSTETERPSYSPSAFVRARKKAGLPKSLVLYCARHDFGTYVLQKTGNIAVVMNAMGHSDVKTAMTYQHPELNVVREAINARQLSGHVLGHRSEMTGRAN